jgi:allophanate hydrolase subunit 1
MRKFLLALAVGVAAWYACVYAAEAMAGWVQWVTL